jgi:hypothetical protein
MITPIDSGRSMDVRQVMHPATEPKTDDVEHQVPPVQKSGEVSQDQVTLKNAGQPDRDR